VEAVRVVVTSPADGTLMTLPREIADRNLEKFHKVRAGDVIAKMDDGPFIAAAGKHENELDKLRRKLSDKQKQMASMTGGAGGGSGGKPAATQKSPDGSLDQLKVEIASLEEEVRFQESILRDLNQKIAACTIRSPVSGTVTSIVAHPGTSVRQGREIMTITEDQGQYIVSYIRPNQGMRPKKDMLVDIRTAERRISRSRVQEVGNDVQPVPPQQLANPRMPEWGVPVRIAMPSDVRLKPGELVGLIYRPELMVDPVTSGAAGASATD
jgi:multidrug resistance efflux pump